MIRTAQPIAYVQTVMLCCLPLVFVVALALGADIHPIVALAVALSPLLLVVSLHPKWVSLVTVLALVILEEFPWGLGETAERSTRTAFYATSLGIPGMYPPDLLVLGSIGLLFVQSIIKRKVIYLPKDSIQHALFLIGCCLILSALLSFTGGSPFHSSVAVETGTVYKVNQAGAELIALFQFKNFAFLIFGYLMGLLYFESDNDVQRLRKGLFIAIAILIFTGLIRLVIKPSLLSNMIPLFYHSPSTWIFALAIFYWIINWLKGLYDHQQVCFFAVLSVFLLLFILISFRRTMWGAIIVASIALLPLLPALIRKKYLLLLATALAGIIVILLAVPSILAIILSRLLETSSEDASTLYRLALFVWFRHNFDDIPLFGYGVRPLWDMAASLGYFRTNLENIHSLYFWLLLRLGSIGFTVVSIAAFFIGRQILTSIRNPQYKRYETFTIIIALALIMLLFSGLFNPVYAEIRYITLTGFALAFISRLPLIRSKSNADGM